MFNMPHGSYGPNGVVSSSAGRRYGHDFFTSTEEGEDIHAVEDRDSWPQGGDFADEHQQHPRHHHHLPVPTSTNSPPMHMHGGVVPVIPRGHLPVPIHRRSTTSSKDAMSRGIGVGVGISEHQQDYGDDQRWGRGQQHQQHCQGVIGGSGSGGGGGQRSNAMEIELHHRATLANNRRTEETNIFSPANEPRRALGGRESVIGSNVGTSAREPPWHSAGLELQGRRNISVKRSKASMGPMSVKDTMSWPLAPSTSRPLPPLAPLPQLLAPHQSQESGDEDKANGISTPGPYAASRDAIDAASQAKQTGRGLRRKRTCQHPGCHRSPSYSGVGQRAVYCAKHKLDGMVNVVSRKCAAPGCVKGPSYGQPGEKKKPVFCSGHRGPDHINVVSPRCAEDGCRKGPSFGCSGTGHRAAYCAKHQLDGMFNVVSKSCREEGCKSAPSFGFEGGRASFCGKHKQDGQRNVISRRCSGPDCTKVPSYGKPGDPRPTFCTHHKSAGAINLLSPRCAAPGCGKGPVGKNAHGQKLRFCPVHSVMMVG